MKTKVTQKYIKAVYDVIFSVGYCGCYHLMLGLNPFAYNCGVYGWNCDYYYTDGVCICTGYRPHGWSTIGKTQEFENRARAIAEDYTIPYKEQMQKIEKIRSEWIAGLLED